MRDPTRRRQAATGYTPLFSTRTFDIYVTAWSPSHRWFDVASYTVNTWGFSRLPAALDLQPAFNRLYGLQSLPFMSIVSVDWSGRWRAGCGPVMVEWPAWRPYISTPTQTCPYLHQAAAARALLDVHMERARHDLGPRPVARSLLRRAGALIVGLGARVHVVVGGTRDDPRAHIAARREHPGVADRMKPRSGHCRAEAQAQRDEVHVDGDGAVGEGLLEGDAHEVVGARDEATRFVIPEGGLLGDGRAKDIAEQGLAHGGIGGARVRGRVQVEALVVRAELSLPNVTP